MCLDEVFMSLKEELTGKQYYLNTRIKLFDAAVTATALYGSAAWALTKDLVLKVQRAQRKMLRMMMRSNQRNCQRRRT